MPSEIFRFQRVSVFLAVVIGFSTGIAFPAGITAQEIPSTPAAKRLVELLKCINETQAESRKPFLATEFANEGDLDTSLDQRMEISAGIHERFSPISILEVTESEELRIVAVCKTKLEVQMQFELTVSAKDGNKITDIGMSPVESDDAESVPEGMVALFGDDGKTAEVARGVWKAKGYGYVLEVTEDAFNFYNVTKSFGWKQEFDEDLFFKEGENSDLGIFTMHRLEPGYNVVRLAELPQHCLKKTEWSSPNTFDAFIEVFRLHYPFFKARNIDWEKRVTQIRPTIDNKATEGQLFDAMDAMLKGLGDGHVFLSAEIEGEQRRVRSDKIDTLKRLRESFEPSEEFKTYQSYFRDWRKRFRDGIIAKTLRGKGKVAANNQIIWGRAHDRVGYIAIFGMGGYSFGNIDSQIKALHNSLDEILTDLADTDALIVDISFNGGGADLFSLEIASRFTNKRRLGFSKWPATEKMYRQDRYVEPRTNVDQDAAMYLKPVYLVTNDVTASAAEIFTMCMRALPQVKTIGLPTEGALSDILSKTLPNGWELGLSNEIYVDHEGICHEGPGVPPQTKMEIFDHNDISKIGHAESMKKIVELILKDQNRD